METPREDSDKPSVEPRGPAVWENWNAARPDRPFPPAYEVPLYTDAEITGGLGEGYGPYRLINVGAPQRRGLARPAIVLRAEAQIVFDTEEILSQVEHLPRGTMCKRYHGGGPDDGVTALFSLSLGIRLKPGDRSREFVPDGDPKGRPLPGLRGEPVLLRNAGRPVIPRAVRKQSLNDDVLVKCLPSLDPDDAFTVVRAARLYQDALWIAESQPQLSWLMFASAVETAAGHCKADTGSARDMVRSWDAELDGLLGQCDGELADKIAQKLVDLMRSKKKFMDFLWRFLPDPPDQRPPEWGRCPWADDERALRAGLARIYDYRSRALHDGSPFPIPMCDSPEMVPVGERKVPVERPIGQKVGVPAAGAEWLASELPMYLHTFEYIVQGALCKWWESMIPKEQAAEALRPCSG